MMNTLNSDKFDKIFPTGSCNSIDIVGEILGESSYQIAMCECS